MRISDIDVIIGQNIRNLRKIKNVSATELIENIGITGWSKKSIKPSMARIEAGKSPLTASLAVCIANELEVPVQEIFRGIANNNNSDLSDMVSPETFFSEDELELVETTRELTAAAKRRIAEYAKYLSSDPKYNRSLKSENDG